MMNPDAHLETLIRLAEQLDIDVRYEEMDGTGGGLCVLRGRRVLFIDTSADPQVCYERVLAALARLPELDQVYVVPEIREQIDVLRARQA